MNKDIILDMIDDLGLTAEDMGASEEYFIILEKYRDLSSTDFKKFLIDRGFHHLNKAKDMKEKLEKKYTK